MNKQSRKGIWLGGGNSHDRRKARRALGVDVSAPQSLSSAPAVSPEEALVMASLEATIPDASPIEVESTPEIMTSLELEAREQVDDLMASIDVASISAEASEALMVGDDVVPFGLGLRDLALAEAQDEMSFAAVEESRGLKAWFRRHLAWLIPGLQTV